MDSNSLWLKTEKQILACIFSGAEISTISAIVSPGDFYYSSTRAIYETALSVTNKGLPVEPVIVLNELVESGQMTPELNAGFISRIMTDEMGLPSTAEQYAQMLKGFSNRRILRSIVKSALLSIEDETIETASVIGDLEKNISSLETVKTEQIVKIGDYQKEFFTRVEAIQNGSGIVGVSTGFKDLDELTGGYANGEFYVVAARPGMGKTAFAMQGLWNIGEYQVPSLFFSLEMSGGQIYTRLACTNSEIDMKRFRTGKLYDTDYPKLSVVAGAIDAAPIYVADTSTCGTDDNSIKSLIRYAKKKLGIKIAVIDYLQLISVKGHRGSRENEVAQITRGLKQTAQQLQLPIVALSQLSRKCEEGLDKRPTLPALRESGAIEQDSDGVIGLYRDEYYNKKTDAKGICEAIVLKQRNGPTDTVKLQFAASYARFGDLESGRDAEEPEEYRQSTWACDD